MLDEELSLEPIDSRRIVWTGPCVPTHALMPGTIRRHNIVLHEGPEVDADPTNKAYVDALAHALSDTVSELASSIVTGWRPAHDWTFNQSFAPVYQLVTTGDVSAYYSPGMRFRCVNGGMTKYFVVVHCAYAAPYGTTGLYVYGGTDYTLGVGVTDGMYSTDAYPVGFPADPRKWSVTVTDTSNRSQATPTLNVWYNLGGVSISIPFGLWRVRYEVSARAISNAGQIGAAVETTLSTAADSEVDKELSAKGDATGATGTIQITETLGRSKVIAQAVESPVAYYLNTRTPTTNQAAIWNINAASTAVITAECAYL